jgi:hypothetical protein
MPPRPADDRAALRHLAQANGIHPDSILGVAIFDASGRVTMLDLENIAVSNLMPLQGMALTLLNLRGTEVSG